MQLQNIPGEMTTDDLQPSPSGNRELPLRPLNTTALSPDAAPNDFDIVATYQQILASDPEMTHSVAAIEALIVLLKQTTSSTAMETLEIVAKHTQRLRASTPNPVPVKAGTELFKQYLVRSLKQQQISHSSSTPSRRGSGAVGGDSALDSFDKTRAHLIANSKALCAKVGAARNSIAEQGARFINERTIVLTAGGSRVVRALLLKAAERHIKEMGSPRFKVIYVSAARNQAECRDAISALRAKGIPVAEVDESTTAHAMSAGKVTMVLLGTESVTQQGGLLSRMGTYQVAQLANNLGKEVTVLAETYKFVQATVLSQSDFARSGVRQTVLDFRAEEDPEADMTGQLPLPEQVDFTPHHLIKRIITEQGVTYPPVGPYNMIVDMYSG